MGLYADNVLPRIVNAACGMKSAEPFRQRVAAGLAGEVVEIGFGSGLNVRWYPPEVTSVTAIEPSDVAWELSAPRRALSDVTVDRAGRDGQHLDLPDASHDGALVTFSLCTVPDPVRALQEARRVVRDGGRLHAVEHGLAPEESVRRWQHRMEPVQRAIFGGCRLTRDVPAVLASAGWRVEDREQDYLPGPALARPWTYVHRLVAV